MNCECSAMHPERLGREDPMRLLTGGAQKFDRPVGIRDPQQLPVCSLPVALLAFERLARRKNFLDVLLPVVHPREFRRRAAGLPQCSAMTPER
jgi:hypothetical protein